MIGATRIATLRQGHFDGNRLARAERTTAQQLCERLGAEAGYQPGTIDLILWRACADGIVDSTLKRK